MGGNTASRTGAFLGPRPRRADAVNPIPIMKPDCGTAEGLFFESDGDAVTEALSDWRAATRLAPIAEVRALGDAIAEFFADATGCLGLAPDDRAASSTLAESESTPLFAFSSRSPVELTATFASVWLSACLPPSPLCDDSCAALTWPSAPPSLESWIGDDRLGASGVVIGGREELSTE